MPYRRRKETISLSARCYLLSFLALFFFLLHNQDSHAFEFSYGDISGNFDTMFSAGTIWRVEKRNPALIGKYHALGTGLSANIDDGNLNYGRGLISTATKITNELEVHYKNYGVFVRTSGIYDHYNMQKTQLSKTAKDRTARDFQLLDAFVSGDFSLREHELNVRLGNQVVSWGESTFVQNGINVINPIDVSKIRIPGSEVREALKPSPMIWSSLQLTDNISIEGFYLARFDHVDADPVGTFFSINDFGTPGGSAVITGNGVNGNCLSAPAACIPRSLDRKARNSGQYGFALRYFSEDLNNTEFGLYFMNYHSRLPLVNAITATTPGAPSTAHFYMVYPEDIKLYGLSFNTSLGRSGIALQGEVSYQTNVPYQFDDFELLSAALGGTTQIGKVAAGSDVSGYRRHNTFQWQFTMTKALNIHATIGADQAIFIGEVAGTHVNLPAKDVLRYEGPGSFLNGTTAQGFADKDSWGYRLLAKFIYNNVLNRFNLTPRLAFYHDVSGTTPGPAINFIEDRKSINIGLSGTYMDSWSADIGYSMFFGAGDFNLINDRDFIGMNIKYSF